MRAIDTNVLVRYVVQTEDAAQARAASWLINDQCSPHDPALVSHVVLAELAWVLKSSFRYSKRQIVGALEAIVENPHFTFDTDTEFLAALDAFRSKSLDFADCLFAARAITHGAGPVYTFDESAAKLPPFQLLSLGP